jgi:hypothetical protein
VGATAAEEVYYFGERAFVQEPLFAARPGEAVQVVPIKPTLKAPGIQLFETQTAFKLCFQFQLAPLRPGGTAEDDGQGLTLSHFAAQPEPFLTQNTPSTPPNTSSHLLQTP